MMQTNVKLEITASGVDSVVGNYWYIC